MITNRTSWNVKGNALLAELVELMHLSADEQAALLALKATAQATAPNMTKAFYDRLFQHAHTAEYLEGASLERLHSMVGDWFVELFGGVYDEPYAEKRLHIGQIHVRIGLPVRYPLAMLDVIGAYGDSIARQSANPEIALAAFRKVFALDVAIFNQAYEDQHLHHLADLVGGERLARLLLTGQD